MATYAFTLILPETDDAVVETIYGTCADASFGKSHGTTYAAFDREAVSLEAAINSAIADLERIGVQPSSIEMDVPLHPQKSLSS